MQLSPRNSESERALRADSASFQTILNLKATMIGPHINTAAGAAEPKASASTSDEMVRWLMIISTLISAKI